MNSVSHFIASLLFFGSLAISFSAPAQNQTLPPLLSPLSPNSRLSRLQADESYIYRNTQTPFSLLQLTRILELTTFFENSKLQAQYSYVENLHDGRGFTAGRIGFCTGTGDLVEVIDQYCAARTRAHICSYQARLHEISHAIGENPNPDVRGLEHFADAWKTAARDQKFQRLQDQALIDMYLNPALTYFKKQNLKWPLTFSVLYDTFIQHGEEGPDGLKKIFDQTNQNTNSENEKEWLNQFLDNRIQVLLNPSNPDTANEWRESVDRAYKLKSILNQDQNQLLKKPIHLNNKTQTD